MILSCVSYYFNPLCIPTAIQLHDQAISPSLPFARGKPHYNHSSFSAQHHPRRLLIAYSAPDFDLPLLLTIFWKSYDAELLLRWGVTRLKEENSSI